MEMWRLDPAVRGGNDRYVARIFRCLVQPVLSSSCLVLAKMVLVIDVKTFK